MTDKWMIRGTEFTNCNCNPGCPCQFGSPSTRGFCEAFISGNIEEGHFDQTTLNGLNWAVLAHWPGEIAAGNGTAQIIIDERATSAQRDALQRILSGQDTKPGSTHFFVFASTMSTILPTLFAPINVTIDVNGRTAEVTIGKILEAMGRPFISPFSGQPVQQAIHLPQGFEFTHAEVGTGTTKSQAGIRLDLKETHGHFNVLHMNQDGVIRSKLAAGN
jgi:hypothetical protein